MSKAKSMYCADEYPAALKYTQSLQPLFKFAGALGAISYTSEPSRRPNLFVQQARDFYGESFGFAAARPGEHDAISS
jgi:hypothetical protein